MIYEYIYIYIYVIYEYIYIYMCVIYEYICVCDIWIYIYIYMWYMNIYVYIYICDIWIYIYVCVWYMNIYIYMWYMNIYIYDNSYIYIYIMTNDGCLIQIIWGLRLHIVQYTGDYHHSWTRKCFLPSQFSRNDSSGFQHWSVEWPFFPAPFAPCMVLTLWYSNMAGKSLN